MAPVRLKALPPLAGAISGLSAGAVVTILLPGALGTAIGLLLFVFVAVISGFQVRYMYMSGSGKQASGRGQARGGRKA